MPVCCSFLICLIVATASGSPNSEVSTVCKISIAKCKLAVTNGLKFPLRSVIFWRNCSDRCMASSMAQTTELGSGSRRASGWLCRFSRLARRSISNRTVWCEGLSFPSWSMTTSLRMDARSWERVCGWPLAISRWKGPGGLKPAVCAMMHGAIVPVRIVSLMIMDKSCRR